MPVCLSPPPLESQRRRYHAAPLAAHPASAEILQERALQNGHVFVASAGAADENSRTGMSFGIAPSTEKCMRAFDGRQNAFELGALGECVQGFIVHRRFVGDAPALHQVGVLRTDT